MKMGPDQSEGRESELRLLGPEQITGRGVGNPDVSAAVSTWHLLKKNRYFRSGVLRGGSSALSCVRKLCLLSGASDEA
jgi:hypothetical protein